MDRLELPQGTLDLLILKIVALEPQHGWAISERLHHISSASLQIRQGSLYPALHRLERRGWIKRAAQVGVVLLPLLVLMTQSRGGFIALALFSICCIVGQWSQLRQVLDPTRRLRLVLTLLAVVFAVAFFAPDGVWARVAGLQHLTTTDQLDQVDQEGSARQRFEIWRVANKIIRENSLTGIGVGAYPQAHAVYARGEEFDPTAAGTRDTHSTYLNVLAETGVPGAIAFFGVVLSVVFQLAHCVEEADFPTPVANPAGGAKVENEWAIHQVLTTANFARRNKFLSWFLGGLNFQVEHHLFHKICHIHYPELSKVVEQVCREFGVRYNANKTFFGALRSHFRWLVQMGRPNVSAG